jgi:hypothetical protein
MADDLARLARTKEDAVAWRRGKAFARVAKLVRRLDLESVVGWLGGTALDPRNAVPQMMLEAVVHVAVATCSAGSGSPTTAHDLRRICAEGFTLFPTALDPPEQPFASPFLFRGTAIAAPQGLVVGAAYDLARTLDAVEVLADRDAAFEGLANLGEMVLRAIGVVTRRAGLVGVVEPAGRHDRVWLPSDRLASRLREAVALSPADLDAIGGDDWRGALEPLVARVPPAEIEWDGHNGTLSYRPFVPTTDGGLLLAVPGMVVRALDQHLRTTIAERSTEVGPLARADAIWTDIERSLRLMGIQPEVQGQHDSEVRWWRLYRVDEEQRLAVVLVTDSGSSADAQIAEARAELVRRVGHQTLIVLFAPVPGEEAFFGLDAPPPGVSELLMRPEELFAFACVEAGEPQSLADFARASSAIREETRVFSFSALDEFANYRANQSSYYLSDEGRPTMISVSPGSALPIRVEAARRSEQDMVVSPSGRPTVVMRRWDNHDGIWGPTTPSLAQGAFIVRTEPPTWVLTPPYEQIQPELVGGWDSVLEAVAYWVYEARDLIGRMLHFASLSFAIVTVEGIETWIADEAHEDDAFIRFRVVARDNVVRLRLLRGLADLAQSPDNEADQRVLAAILEGLSVLTGYPGLDDIRRTIEAVAPPGPKKMLIRLDVTANPDIGPDDVPRWRRVRDAPSSVILDELGDALRKRIAQPLSADAPADSVGILNDAVKVLLEMLEQEVERFRPTLLDALLLRNEAILRERADAAFHLVPRLACFPGDLADAQKRVEGLDAASVAGRFLIEYVATQPPNGERDAGVGAVDRLVAIADMLIGRANASDIEFLGLATVNARILASGRLGIDDRAMSAAWNAFQPSLQLTRLDDARRSFTSRWRDPTGGSELELEALNRACRAEWGFSFTELGQLVGAAISMSMVAEAPVFALPATGVTGLLAADAELAPDTVDTILAQLTLEPRARYLDPPAGFRRTDLYPWRYNRPLSLLRRPFIRRDSSGDREIVFGRRALYSSFRYLLELIETSRLRPQSPEMTEYIGRKSVERGTEFNDSVAGELADMLGQPVRRRVTKIGQRKIANEQGVLGDIDVLAVDEDRRIIWAVECKALAPARTPGEAADELRDLLGEDGRLGHLGKHTRMVEWLREHGPELLAELGLEDVGWRIEGLFVVDEDLYGPYFRETTVPVIPLLRLRDTVLG